MRFRLDGRRRAWIAIVALLGLGLAAFAVFRRPAGGPVPSGDPPAAPVEEPAPEIASAGSFEDDCGRDAVHLDDVVAGGLPRGDAPVVPPEAGFSLQFGDEVSPWSLMSTMRLPGEVLDVAAVEARPASRFAARAEAGRLVADGSGRWRWELPREPGVYCLTVTEQRREEVARLNVFVARPYEGQEVFHGYRIGRYEDIPLRGLPAYERPRGLLEVDEEALGTWVSPHFQLSQLVGKQESPLPRFMVLSSRLLLKLEALLEQVNQRGIPASTFFFVSAYRTPFYNAAIGNRTSYSRHAYGDAADIFVDEDRDGMMDDLDGNGRVDIGDARVLQAIVEGVEDEAWYRPFVGGLGLYGPTPAHPPFVHLDTRGYEARWAIGGG